MSFGGSISWMTGSHGPTTCGIDQFRIFNVESNLEVAYANFYIVCIRLRPSTKVRKNNLMRKVAISVVTVQSENRKEVVRYLSRRVLSLHSWQRRNQCGTWHHTLIYSLFKQQNITSVFGIFLFLSYNLKYIHFRYWTPSWTVSTVSKYRCFDLPLMLTADS